MITLPSVTAVLGEIASFEDPRGPFPERYLDRIHSLIAGCPDDWDRLYDTVSAAQLDYCPYHAGIPQEAIGDDQLSDEWKSIVEIFLEHMDELSGPEWFDCNPGIWLGMVAAHILGNRLSMYRLVKYAISTATEPIDPEILEHLPLQVPAAYWHCSEALIAGEVLHAQSERLKDRRTARAKRGAQARNKAYVEARAKFIDFYLENTHLSRAEAARRFFRTLNSELAGGARPIYNSEESAVRALREALKRAGI